jgi:hypothetical protein
MVLPCCFTPFEQVGIIFPPEPGRQAFRGKAAKLGKIKPEMPVEI